MSTSSVWPADFVFGAAPLGNLFAAISDADSDAALIAAWNAGLRTLDTAPLYGMGRSEARIGAFHRRNPDMPFVLSTKVGRCLEPVGKAPCFSEGFADPLPNAVRFDYSRQGILQSFGASLARLGVDRIDTLLLHDIGRRTHGDDHPAVLHQALDEALPTMAQLKHDGLVQRVGLGINECEVADAVIAHADVDVILLAGRYTLLDQSGAALLGRCRTRNIAVWAAGVFNSGVLAGGTSFDYADADQALLARRDAVAALCANYGVTLPAAAIRFVAAHRAVAKVVVGLRSADEVAALAESAQADIPPDLWAAMAHAGLLPEGAVWP